MRPATYARYSSSNQREASIEDQLRDNVALCGRLGLPEPVVYSDKEISGERRDRPGYVRLLRDAQARIFDVLILWDLKRLSRAEDLPQVLARFKFWGVRVVTCDGYDSLREDADMRGWIDGLIGNKYLRDLAKATHRGLTGRAMDGASAGGKAYGYIVTKTGERAIDPEQAEVVRRIFADYLQGKSPRAIAFALNQEGVPSPRGSVWAASSIRADRTRSIGILANPIYAGRQIWNRSRHVKNPETGRRVRQERPQSEWIVRELPHLAIVDLETWEATQRRLQRNGHNLSVPRPSGRPPKHVLSGIMRCAECGGPIVVVDRYRYGCARAKESGACGNLARASRDIAERVICASVQQELLTEAAFRRFQSEAMAEMKRRAPDLEALERDLAKAKRLHGNVMNAILAGVVTPSTKAELEAREAAIAAAERAIKDAQAFQPARILPRARSVWERMVANVASYARDVPAARSALQTLIGGALTLRADENGDPIAEIAASASQIRLVAGAGFEPATFGL